GELRDAGSLQALAEERGTGYDELEAAVLADVTDDLEAAVEEGMSQERADAVIERLTTWLDEGGPVRQFKPGRGGFHPRWPFHGPWGDQGDPEA
ncbi:MAG: hypothetical protein ACLGHT_02075, partial [Acidimicrobiia bacterium]